MTTFIAELEKFSDLEREYHTKYPQAQPLGNFYHYFGISGMLNILSESEGREIEFHVEPTTEQCIYSFK